MPAAFLANSEARPGVETTVNALRTGASALDAIEKGIRVVERDPAIRSVGFGGVPNILGEMELDASLMCGVTRRTGAVGALKGFMNPISVARQVMERTPHVMLVGEGAARFAADIGAERGELLSSQSRDEYRRWFEANVPQALRDRWPDVPLHELIPAMSGPDASMGTTCFLACAAAGGWGGGVSTSGWAYKHPGRLGDSPVIGAGLYVDDRYGAAACTNTGEMTVRASTARTVVTLLKRGASVEEACNDALDDLRELRGGYQGGVILHAVDRAGTPCVMGLRLRRPSTFWYWREGMDRAETRPVTEVS